MAVNETLNSFVDLEAAIKQFDYLKRRVDEYVIQIDKASKLQLKAFADLSTVKNVADLANVTKQAAEANKQAAEAANGHKQAVEENDSFLKTHASTISENVKKLLDYKKQLEAVKNEVKRLKNSTGDYSDQINKLTQDEFQLKNAISEATIAIKTETKERNAAKGSIDEMEQKLGRLRDTLRGLSSEEYNSPELDGIKEEINRLDAAVKQANFSMGNFQKNVGNYPNATAELKAIREEVIKLYAAGKETGHEFDELNKKANDLGYSVNKFGSLSPNGPNSGFFSGSNTAFTSASAGLTSVSQHLSTVNSQMQQLAVEGKEDSDEFKRLGELARQLQHTLDLVKNEMKGVHEETKKTAEGVASIGQKLTNFAKGLVATLGAYLSFEGIKQVVSDSVDELLQADKAADQLKNTLKNLGAVELFNRFSSQADDFVEKLKYLDNDDVTQVFDNLLTYGKLTEQQMNALLPVIADFAAKENVGLVEASETIIKALEGNGKALKKYGVDIADATDETETAASAGERLTLIMKELKPRVEGSAQAFAGSFPGLLATIKQGIKDTEEQLGHFIEKLLQIDETAQKAAVTSKKEADQAQALINEYTALTDKVNKTAAEKERLNLITAELTGIFGNSVTSINAETGAIELNIEATKDLIKQKLLLSNQRASELALRFNKASSDEKDATDNLTLSTQAYNTALKASGATISDIYRKRRQFADENEKGNNALLSDEEKLVLKLAGDVSNYKQAIFSAVAAKNEALKGLKPLGYDETDISKLFNPNPKITPKEDKPTVKPVKDQTNNELKIQQELTKELYSEYAKRLQLEAEAQKAISEDDSKSYEDRLQAYMAYSDKSLQAQRENLSAEYTAVENGLAAIEKIEQLPAKKRTNEQKELLAKKELFLQQQNTLTAQYGLLEAQEIDKTAKGIVAIQQEEVNKRIAAINSLTDNVAIQEQQALAILAKSLEDGTIKYADYVEKKKKLEQQFQAEKNRQIRDYLQAEIDALSKQGVNTAQLQAQLNKAMADLYSQDADNAIAAAEKKKAVKESVQQKEWEAVREGTQAVQSFVDQAYQKELSKIQEKADLIEKNKQAEIDGINNSMLSEEKKAQRVKEITAQAGAQQRELQQKESEIKRKQAIADKAAALLTIAENTAMGITAVFANPVTALAAPVLVPLIAGIGAVQAAVVLAKPIPYATGTDDHPGGLALIGEEHKPELVIEPNRAPYIIDQPTVKDLPIHSRVIPEAQFIDNIAALSGFGISPATMQQLIINSGNGVDFAPLATALRDEMAATRKTMEQSIANIPQTQIVAKNGEFLAVYKTRGNVTTTVNNKIR